MKRVLVTGATGCIGRHLVPILLSRGWEVHGIVSPRGTADRDDVVWHRADLLDPRGVEETVRSAGASHLAHLAWYVAPGRWAASPENFAWAQASLGLLRAFQAAGGTRVVTAGSCLEYDWRYGRCSESRTPCAPHTMYGACKHGLQVLSTAMDGAGALSSAWARIFFLYGPHEHPDRLVAAVIRSLLAGEPARCSHGRQIRDYLFVEDVADAMARLLESDVRGPINVASGVPIALRDIVTRIGALVGRPELIRLGAIPPASTDVPIVVADTTRLEQELEWRPRWDLDAGLQKTIAWWREARVPAAQAEPTR
jgi:nucleoside-diphosphate-sugar epimerase